MRRVRRYRRQRRRPGFFRARNKLTLMRNFWGSFGSYLPQRYMTRLSYRAESTNVLSTATNYSPLNTYVFRGCRPSDPSVTLDAVKIIVGYSETNPYNGSAGSDPFPNVSVANWDVNRLGSFYNACRVMGLTCRASARIIDQQGPSTQVNPGVWLCTMCVDPAILGEVMDRIQEVQQSLVSNKRVMLRQMFGYLPFFRATRISLDHRSYLRQYSSVNRVLSRRYQEEMDLVHDFPGVQCPESAATPYYQIVFLFSENVNIYCSVDLQVELTYHCLLYGRKAFIGTGQISRETDADPSDETFVEPLPSAPVAPS